MRLARDTRQTLGLAIEALIELVDSIGPDPEAEPSLANPNGINQAQSWGYDTGNCDDREGEHDGAEPNVDDEPSLGALQHINQDQFCWTNGAGWAALVVDGEMDADAEASLAVPEGMNQASAWARPGNGEDLEEEHDGCEPEDDKDDTESSMPILFDYQTRSQILAANKQAREALRDLLERLRPEVGSRLTRAL